MDEHDSFPQRVWQIVASIPEGYVTTYGDVAQLAGSPRAARQVGGVLKRLPEGSSQGRRRGCRDVAGRAPTHLRPRTNLPALPLSVVIIPQYYNAYTL